MNEKYHIILFAIMCAKNNHDTLMSFFQHKNSFLLIRQLKQKEQ